MRVRTVLLMLLALTACSGTDRPFVINAGDVAARLGCTQTTTVAPQDSELYTNGQAECRYAGDVVNIRVFQNDEMRDNWLIEVDRYRAHFCRARGVLLYGKKLETADAIAGRLRCEVVRHD